MTKHSNKIATLIAFSLLSFRAKGDATPAIADQEQLKFIFSEIRRETIANPDLLPALLDLTKPELEISLGVSLTDDEYVSLENLVHQLMAEGVVLEAVPVDVMTLSTQEYNGR